MGSAVLCAVFVVALILAVDGDTEEEKKKECYLLPSRPGRCIYVLKGAEKGKCLSEYAGFEYIPTQSSDLTELRKIFYWRGETDVKYMTGLWYHTGKDLFFKTPPDDGNVWEKYNGITHVDKTAVNFKAQKSKHGDRVVIEITNHEIPTYTQKDTANLPLLCEASRHPELPCPGDFKIFRPSKRCFKCYTGELNPIQAEETCKLEFSTTASVNNKAENEHIRQLCKPGGKIWLGMRFAWKTINQKYGTNTPKASSGDAVFVPFIKQYMYNLDGFPIGNYHNFYSDQPDFGTPNEFFILQMADKKWHDFGRGHKAKFACSLLPDQTIHE